MAARPTFVCTLLFATAALPAHAEQVVTLRVPVTLQNLHEDVGGMRVLCMISSQNETTGWSGKATTPIDGGFKGSVDVKVPIPDGVSPIVPRYRCVLHLLTKDWMKDLSHHQGVVPPDLHFPAFANKPGTPYVVVVEGPLLATPTARASNVPAAVAPAAASATPAWGAIGSTPPVAPAPSPAAQRSPMKSALPGTPPGK